MSAPSNQQPLNNHEGEAVSAPRKEAFMAEFMHLATRARFIDARLLELHATHESFSRGLPTEEESAAKPLRADRLADARLRGRAKKNQYDVRVQISEMAAQRRALSRAVQDLIDRLSALGVTVESPWLPRSDLPLALLWAYNEDPSLP